MKSEWIIDSKATLYNSCGWKKSSLSCEDRKTVFLRARYQFPNSGGHMGPWKSLFCLFVLMTPICRITWSLIPVHLLDRYDHVSWFSQTQRWLSSDKSYLKTKPHQRAKARPYLPNARLCLWKKTKSNIHQKISWQRLYGRHSDGSSSYISIPLLNNTHQRLLLPQQKGSLILPPTALCAQFQIKFPQYACQDQLHLAVRQVSSNAVAGAYRERL